MFTKTQQQFLVFVLSACVYKAMGMNVEMGYFLCKILLFWYIYIYMILRDKYHFDESDSDKIVEMIQWVTKQANVSDAFVTATTLHQRVPPLFLLDYRKKELEIYLNVFIKEAAHTNNECYGWYE